MLQTVSFPFFVVNVQVSAPYIIAGRIHWLKTFLFKQVGSVPYMIVPCLPNVCHPDLIILILLSTLFISINVKRWPR